MTVRFAGQLAGILAVGVVIACTSCLWACDVPVFRYALECWPAAPYEVTVLHRAPLSAAERECLKPLSSAPPQGIPRANVTARLADLSDPSGGSLQRLWRELDSPALPLMILHDLHTRRPVWSGPLTADNAKFLVDSPARREIARRILEGHSAVWVLVQSGDRAKDTAAGILLQKTLRDLQQTLKLPVAQGSAPLSRDDPARSIQPPLQLRFSLLTVSRRDPAESVFIRLLLHSEQDLDRYASEPMVFPIYGRGRILYALVGKGITRENLQEAGKFLVGFCSCEAKEQNPGTDLLMAADWEAHLVGSAQQTTGPQPLVGLAALSTAARNAKSAPVRKAMAPKTPGTDNRKPPASAPATSSPPPGTALAPDAARAPAKAPAAAPHASIPACANVSSPEPSGGPLRNMLLALGAIVVVAVLLGVLAAMRRPEERP